MMDLSQMQAIMERTVSSATKMARDTAGTNVWRVKKLQRVDNVEDFLNDGKRVISASLHEIQGEIYVLYCVAK